MIAHQRAILARLWLDAMRAMNTDSYPQGYGTERFPARDDRHVRVELTNQNGGIRLTMVRA
jgi:hypothetical protein